ncbi:hypothetical protein ACOMHN_062118 [Nucella lapillus]
MGTISTYLTNFKASMMERLSGLHQRVGDSSAEFWSDDDNGDYDRWTPLIVWHFPPQTTHGIAAQFVVLFFL